MDIRFAPLEGLTDAVYRRVHHQCFGGVARYYIPFVSPTQNHLFTVRELRAVAPEHNQGVPAVPQLLGKDASHMLWAMRELADMGYDQVNLNLGCPSATVTAKGKGSGMLRDTDSLRCFLDEVMAGTPLPVSVKTRIGYDSAEEWPALLDLLSDYPFCEVIVHPRTRQSFYKGPIVPDAFALAAEKKLPLVYNGDLFSAGDLHAFRTQWDGMPVMLGRGLTANPALAREMNGGEGLTIAHIRRFHDELEDAYRRLYDPHQVHSRMCEVMKYIACCFDSAEKARKALRKSTPATYPAAVERLLACPLRSDPGYWPGAWTD